MDLLAFQSLIGIIGMVAEYKLTPVRADVIFSIPKRDYTHHANKWWESLPTNQYIIGDLPIVN